MDKDKKRKKVSPRIEKIIKIYLFPIATLLIFLSLVVLLILPKVSEISDQLGQLNTNNQIVSDDNNSLAILSTVSSKIDNLNSLLSTVNLIAPSGTTKVVDFRNKISNLVSNDGLTIGSQKLTEILNDTSTNTVGRGTNELTLQEVPFDFDITGSFKSISKFILDLGKIDDFIIVKKMSLDSINRSTVNSGDWKLQITIVKYQFKTVVGNKLDATFLKVPPTATISSKMLTFLNLRSNNPTTTPTTPATFTKLIDPSIPVR